MKRYFPLLLLLLALCCLACKKHDRIVAEVYYQKLYASEVAKQIPSGLSIDDSLAFANRIIEDWITDQIILREAENSLSMREKNVDMELKKYKNELLIYKYLDKISQIDSISTVSDEELSEFMKENNREWAQEQELVKINYVKLSFKSSILPQIKEILFDEDRRKMEKSVIEKICADSVEYFIDDDQWLSWGEIKQEIDVNFAKNNASSFPLYFEKQRGESYYLIVILDYKMGNAGAESAAYKEEMRMMLAQRKKTNFIKHHVEQLYQKVEKSGKIIK